MSAGFSDSTTAAVFRALGLNGCADGLAAGFAGRAGVAGTGTGVEDFPFLFFFIFHVKNTTGNLRWRSCECWFQCCCLILWVHFVGLYFVFNNFCVFIEFFI